jgi:malonyl-CoA/methylmalonyl-CoA synthetase
MHTARFKPDEVLERLLNEDFNLFMAVPTIYGSLINYIREQSKVEADFERRVKQRLSKYRLMVSGSAALPEPHFHEWHQLSGQRLLERFGMTELHMAISNPYHPAENRQPGTVGKPLPGVTAAIMDPATGEILIGEEGEGELLIKSRNMFNRYLNKPEATAAEFH